MADATARAGATARMRRLMERLYPICRSITGPGIRQTLNILAEHLPLELTELPSGSPVLDWTVPKEWSIREAWLKAPNGEKVVDFSAHNLHVVSFSCGVHDKLTLEELRPHLYSLPEHPDWIPYRTTYYAQDWGFCLSHRQLMALTPGDYEVFIDASHEDGALIYGECFLPGESEGEVLISAHACHPSLCNDNLSGIAVATELYRALQQRRKRRFGVRLLFAPGTIGAIAWLSRNPDATRRVKAGWTLTCLGDDSPLTYKRTFAGRSLTDRATEHTLATLGSGNSQVIDFFPYGYDERQFNSPGFRLPVGSLMRGRHGHFPQYHTSADNLSFVEDERLLESLQCLEQLVLTVDGNATFRNLQPYGEPQLGRRGLYRATGGADIPDLNMAMLWVLSCADGNTELLETAQRSGLSFPSIQTAAKLLAESGLLEEAKP